MTSSDYTSFPESQLTHGEHTTVSIPVRFLQTSGFPIAWILEGQYLITGHISIKNVLGLKWLERIILKTQGRWVNLIRVSDLMWIISSTVDRHGTRRKFSNLRKPSGPVWLGNDREGMRWPACVWEGPRMYGEGGKATLKGWHKRGKDLEPRGQQRWEGALANYLVEVACCAIYKREAPEKPVAPSKKNVSIGKKNNET